MIGIYTILWILFSHWVCDFVLQTDNMALGKSKNMSDLLDHTGVYSLCMFMMLFGLVEFTDFTWWDNLGLCTISFFVHTTQDYFTSRINARLWAQEKRHEFFVSVGFDQFLHFAQLLFTYKILMP